MSSLWRQWKSPGSMIGRFIRINRKRRFFVLSLFTLLFFFGVFGLAEPARAQSLLTFGVNQLMQFFTWVMFIIARLCIGLTIFSLKFFIEVAEYNNYIDTATVKLGWLMVRDVANMFFVVVLLMIAFGTILGIESYEWSKTLVKLVLAAVFINFSNLIAQLIIDVAHVFTMTFLNAISATAGGNLISMFKIEKIMAITGQEFDQGAELALELFAASVIAFLLALFMFLIVGAYLAIMVARMVVLWVLIILSPLAYIFAVVPQTQEYANKWWSQFNKQVVVAPVMVFFLWLSFATLGSGTLAKTGTAEGGLGLELDSATSEATAVVGVVGGKPLKKLTISDASTWENLADYIVSLAFLFVGLKVVGELGVVGGGIASGFVSFGKSVAKIATGYMVGRWAYEKGMGVTKSAIGKGLYYMPLVGGEKIAMKAKTIGHAMRDWYYEKGTALTKKGYGLQEEARGIWEKQGKMREAIKGAKTPEEREKLEAEYKPKQATMEARLGEIEEEIKGEYAGNILGKIARSGIKTEKQLTKTQKQADNRRLILWKQTGSEAGGNVLFGKWGMGSGTKGIGFGDSGKFRLFGDRFIHDKELAEQVYGKRGITARDRVERGWLQAEEARSKAKDEEFEGMGKQMALGRARLKFDVKDGSLTFQVAKGSMLDQINSHKLAADTHGEVLKRLEGEAKLRVMFGEVNPATMKGGYEQFLHQKAGAEMIANILKEDEERVFEEVEKGEYNAGLLIDNAAKKIANGDYNEEGRDLLAKKDQLDAENEKQRTEKLGALDQTVEAQRKEYGELLGQIGNIDRLEKNITELITKKQQIETERAGLADNDPKKQALLVTSQDMDVQIEQARVKRSQAGDRDPLQTRFEEVQKKLVEAEHNVRNAEKELEDTDQDWKELQEKRSNNKHALEGLRKKELDTKGWRLRNGDESVVAEAIEDIEERLRAETDETKKKKLEKDKEAWETVAHELHRGSLAFRYGVAKGKRTDKSKGYRYAHNKLLSEAEQRAVFDDRGLNTPLSTLTEMIEEYGKSFSDMSIEAFVANVGPMLVKMKEKLASKEGLTEEDRASLMGLFKRGFDRAWVDDAIYGIFDNDEAKKAIADVIGWKNTAYTDDKIRDIQMLFATGGDVEFVRDNAVISYLQDVSENDLGISTANFLKGLETGSFIDKRGKDVAEEVKQKAEALIKKNNVTFTEEQKQLFDRFFSTEEKAIAERKKTVATWFQTVEDRQSEFEFLGNLRPEALKNGHIENAGWALGRDVGGGNTLYIPMSIRSANNHVMGDARKMDQRSRSGMQSHSFAYLTEKYGQVLLRVMGDRYADLMTGIDPRSFNAVNTRAKIHFVGLSGADKISDFRDKESNFLASKLRDERGNLTRSAQAWIEEFRTALKDDALGREFEEADTEEKLAAVIAKAKMQKVFSEEMHANIGSFVMLAAEASGMSPQQAFMDGKIRFKIYNPIRKEEKVYTDINDLTKDYNNGDWTDGVAPETQLSEFIPAIQEKQTKEKTGKKKTT